VSSPSANTLRELVVVDTGLEDDGLAELVARLPALTRLDARSNKLTRRREAPGIELLLDFNPIVG
jgi:hypothetical protein